MTLAPDKANHGASLWRIGFLFLILWIAFILRLIYVRQVSPFVDEYISMLAMQSIIKHGTPILPSGLFYGPKALLHSYIGVLALWLFGLSEFAVRFSSVLIGVATVSCIYKVGQQWFSSVVGLSAAMALAWLPSAVEWGGRVRMYSLLQLLILIGVYLFIDGYLKNYTYRVRVAGMFILLLASVFVHTLAFIVIGGLVVAIIISRLITFSRPKPILWPHFWEVLAGIVFIIVVIVFNPIGGRAWGPQLGLSDFQGPLTFLQERTPYLLAFTHQFVIWPLWPLSIFYIIGLISLLLRLKRKSLILGDEIALSLYFLVLCTWLGVSISARFHEDRYLFAILPFYLLLAFREIYLLTEVIFTSIKGPSVLLSDNLYVSSVISLLIVVLLAPSFIQLVSKDTYGFTPAYLYVRHNWRDGDVIATCSPAASQLVLGHTDYYVIQYGAESDNGVDVWTGAPLINTPEEFQAVLEDNPRVWFVVEKLCWERHFDVDFQKAVNRNMQITLDYKGMLVFVSNRDRTK